MSFVSFEFYYFITLVESNNSNKPCFTFLCVPGCIKIRASHFLIGVQIGEMCIGLYIAPNKYIGICTNTYVTLNNHVSESARWQWGRIQRSSECIMVEIWKQACNCCLAEVVLLILTIQKQYCLLIASSGTSEKSYIAHHSGVLSVSQGF